MMLLARDENGEPAMSDQQLHDEVMTFYIAGSNTISNTLYLGVPRNLRSSRC